MAAPPSAYKDRHFLAVIGDEVSMIKISLAEHKLMLLLLLGLGDRPLTSWDRSMRTLSLLKFRLYSRRQKLTSLS